MVDHCSPAAPGITRARAHESEVLLRLLNVHRPSRADEQSRKELQGMQRQPHQHCLPVKAEPDDREAGDNGILRRRRPSGKRKGPSRSSTSLLRYARFRW